MKNKTWRFFWIVLLAIVLTGVSSMSAQAASEKPPQVGSVKINPHLANLEGRTILLRWNGKMNGDKYLTRVGEQIAQQIKNVKIVKLWETDKATAAISKDLQASLGVAEAIAKIKPDLVIAAQAD